MQIEYLNFWYIFCEKEETYDRFRLTQILVYNLKKFRKNL